MSPISSSRPRPPCYTDDDDDELVQRGVDRTPPSRWLSGTGGNEAAAEALRVGELGTMQMMETRGTPVTRTN